MNRFTYYSLFAAVYALYSAVLCLSLAFLHLHHFDNFAFRYWYIGATVAFFLFWGLARSLAWLEEPVWLQSLIWFYAAYLLVSTFYLHREPTDRQFFLISRWVQAGFNLLPVIALLCVRTPAVKPYCTFYAMSQLAEIVFVQGAGWWGLGRADVISNFILVLLVFRWLMAMILLFFFLRMVLYSREPDPLQEAIDHIGQAPSDAEPDN